MSLLPLCSLIYALATLHDVTAMDQEVLIPYKSLYSANPLWMTLLYIVLSAQTFSNLALFGKNGGLKAI